MEREKILTISVAAYNLEKLITKNLDSFINSDVKDKIEIIVTDDESKDNTASIVEEYELKYPGIVKLVRQKNMGPGSSINNGIKFATGKYFKIENSTGKYICFIDSDDYISECYLEKLYNNTEEECLVMCEILRFGNGKILNEKILSNNTNIYEKNKFLELYKMGLINSPCARLYKKSIIDSSKIQFDENLSLGEDLLFNFEYLKKIKNIKLLSNIYYYYRQENENSLSTKYVEDMLNIQRKLCIEFCEFFKENSEREKSDDIINFCSTIVSNEFHNKSKNIFIQYINARKILKNNWVKNTIEMQKKYMNKIEFFCLKNNLYLTYKLIKK